MLIGSSLIQSRVELSANNNGAVQRWASGVMPLLLSCQSLSKSFGARPLFEDISLSISDGDRLGLIGPNGSGKSTLLRVLAGRQSPDPGSTAGPEMGKPGYVPQDVHVPSAIFLPDILPATAPHT